LLSTIGRCAFNRNLNDGFNCGGAIDILPLARLYEHMNQAAC
jgi:hypothetical protein